MADKNKSRRTRDDYEQMTDAQLITIIGDVDPATNRADLIILAEEADRNR
jgi:hypothetical protein